MSDDDSEDIVALIVFRLLSRRVQGSIASENIAELRSIGPEAVLQRLQLPPLNFQRLFRLSTTGFSVLVDLVQPHCSSRGWRPLCVSAAVATLMFLALLGNSASCVILLPWLSMLSELLCATAY